MIFLPPCVFFHSSFSSFPHKNTYGVSVQNSMLVGHDRVGVEDASYKHVTWLHDRNLQVQF